MCNVGRPHLVALVEQLEPGNSYFEHPIFEQFDQIAYLFCQTFRPFVILANKRNTRLDGFNAGSAPYTPALLAAPIHFKLVPWRQGVSRVLLVESSRRRRFDRCFAPEETSFGQTSRFRFLL